MKASPACILFFVRYPVQGMVKTRLACSMGHEQATALYTAFVEHLFAGLQRISHETGAVLRLVYDVESVCAAKAMLPCCEDKIGKNTESIRCQDLFSQWLGHCSCTAQCCGDIGERMHKAMEDAFTDGFERVILLGSDIPDFPIEHVRMALQALEPRLSSTETKSLAVINPTEDGGYCLIGFHKKAFMPAVFQSIPWSTSSVFSATMQCFQKAGYTPHILPVFYDIDTLEDVQKLYTRNKQTDFAHTALFKQTEAILSAHYIKKNR